MRQARTGTALSSRALGRSHGPSGASPAAWEAAGWPAHGPRPGCGLIQAGDQLFASQLRPVCGTTNRARHLPEGACTAATPTCALAPPLSPLLSLPHSPAPTHPSGPCREAPAGAPPHHTRTQPRRAPLHRRQCQRRCRCRRVAGVCRPAGGQWGTEKGRRLPRAARPLWNRGGGGASGRGRSLQLLLAAGPHMAPPSLWRHHCCTTNPTSKAPPQLPPAHL